MTRIDAHQHFWHYSAEEYGWIGEDMAVLRRDHLPVDFVPLLVSANMGGSVAVQARQSLQETRWLLELAEENSFIRGVVGWVDLRSPELRGQLERFSAHERFCGVRHVLQDEPDDKFMLRADFQRGLRLLADYGLTYDLLLLPRHLPVACEVVARYPDQPFILDHIAKPMIRQGALEPWATDIRRLADFPNVVCKVSGMVTEAAWHQWQQTDFEPFLAVVFEAFGSRRIMYGSDWPVCSVAASYSGVVGILSTYTEKLSGEEKADIWGGTASRFYGLE